MKELEQMIIGSCLGEDQFKKVRFLEPNDFTDDNCREFFRLIIESKANENILLACISKCKENETKGLLTAACYPVAFARLHVFALKLLEKRFERLLGIMLGDLSVKTKNVVEAKLLNDVIQEIGDVDIFDLSGGMIEYLGSQISQHTKSRILDFHGYMDRRAKEAREIINGS